MIYGVHINGLRLRNVYSISFFIFCLSLYLISLTSVPFTWGGSNGYRHAPFVGIHFAELGS